MEFTIDNLDGAGARNYTSSLDAERPPRVRRVLNRPSELRAWLHASGSEFVVPEANARVTLARNDGTTIFTGYVSAAPAYEYLGWTERGPAYRYGIHALSDEWLLARKPVLARSDFVHRAAGEVLKTLANDLAPGHFDTAGCADIATLPSYFPDPRQNFAEHAAELALRARAAYRAQDGQLFFRPLGETEHALTEEDAEFSPEGLKVECAQQLLNDVTVVGAVEPGAYVKDYFAGDDYTLGFYLSNRPFLRPGTMLVDEEYLGNALRPAYWTASEGAAASVSGGSLHVSGTAQITLVEPVELGGGLALDHGDFEFTAAADELLGGLYDGNVSLQNCFAGFHVAASAGGQFELAAVVGGAAAGETLATRAGCRYALSTRIYAGSIYREAQTFCTCEGTRGGDLVESAARVLLQAREIDPNDAASLVAPATVLFEGWLPEVPAFCTYALIVSTQLHASIAFTRLARMADVEVRTCATGGSWRSRVAGSQADGGECRVGASNVYFFPASAPAVGEKIVISYRTAARALARVVDETSVAELQSGSDDGHRAAVLSLQAPRPRTSEDCEQAAATLLQHSVRPGWRGEYEFCSAGEAVYPGDALPVNAPTRDALFTALVREVEIEAVDLLDDRARVRLVFADESAEPLAMRLEPAPQLRLPERYITAGEIGAGRPPDPRHAEVVDIGSTNVMIDGGADPVSGGGFEVRRSDSGWGMENDRNLVGRFDYRIFTVPRTSRAHTWYLRQYDASSPVRYSRRAAVLHIDCPL